MELFFSILGNGPHILLAFHGIGQTGNECFHSFAQQVGHLYTIYAFDLPFHGQSSSLQPGHTLFQKDLTKYIDNFLVQQGINNFGIIGFSIGGRFAISVAAHFVTRVNELILIAPDGIYPHPLYQLATANTFTHTLFRMLMNYPSLVITTAKVLAKLGFFTNGIANLLTKLLSSSAKRDQIYHSWIAFRHLQLPPSQWYLVRDLPISIFLAKYDFLIPTHSFSSLFSSYPTINSTLFSVGHFSLVPLVGKYLAQHRS